jgi:hypothetical protein
LRKEKAAKTAPLFTSAEAGVIRLLVFKLSDKIYNLIETGWDLYTEKVSGLLLDPENEKMMQLQLASIFQSLAGLYESSISESIKILLEVPVQVRADKKNIIDIVISHQHSELNYYPIELKCFREMTRDKKKNRGGGNLSMYDYWKNIELYSGLENYMKGIHLALTDNRYFVDTEHTGDQVKVYSTFKKRGIVTGELKKEIQTRDGLVFLKGNYDMSNWECLGDFFKIMQTANNV